MPMISPHIVKGVVVIYLGASTGWAAARAGAVRYACPTWIRPLPGIGRCLGVIVGQAFPDVMNVNLKHALRLFPLYHMHPDIRQIHPCLSRYSNSFAVQLQA